MSVAATEALIRKYLEHPEKATPEELQAAQDAEKQALRTVGLTAGPLVNTLMDYMFAGDAVWTLGCKTKQTSMMGGSRIVYARNPHFQLELDPEGRHIVDIHEALHPMKEHLNRMAFEALGIDSSDPVLTLAFEAALNYEATLIAGGGSVHAPMPTIKGKVTGVDYEAVYKEYATDLRAQGLNPLTMKEFYKTDITTYHELKKMKKVKERDQYQDFCQHSIDDEDSGPESELRKKIREVAAKLAKIGEALAAATAAAGATGGAAAGGAGAGGKKNSPEEDLIALGNLMKMLAEKIKAEAGEGHKGAPGTPNASSTPAAGTANVVPSPAVAPPATTVGAVQMIEAVLPKLVALLDALEVVLEEREVQVDTLKENTDV